MDRQTTVEREASFSGKGLHTGAHATLRVLPAGADSGVVFRRVDLPGAPEVRADLDNVTATERGTVVTQGAASAATIEHFLGALYGLGVDNALVELSGPEVPIADGSASDWIRILAQAGLKVLEAPRRWLDVNGGFEFEQGAKKLTAKSHGSLEVLYRIDYHHPQLGQQEAHFVLTPGNFAESVAPARTFCFEFEVEAMRKAGLIKGGDLNCALVIGEKGLLNPPLRFPDEFVRHKVLDFLGDLSLCGARVRASFEIDRAGHQFHVEAIKALKQQNPPKAGRTPVSESAKPSPALMDVNEIMRLLPHRPPFLMIDKITGLNLKQNVLGEKNVTMNEWYFQGHFPGHPIMPGVLIVEAMAQCGGILIMKSFPETAGKLTYFMGIDNVRFRRPVIPGDTLKFNVEIVKVKGPVSRLKGTAHVGDELATEAEFMCMVVDKK